MRPDANACGGDAVCQQHMHDVFGSSSRQPLVVCRIAAFVGEAIQAYENNRHRCEACSKLLQSRAGCSAKYILVGTKQDIHFYSRLEETQQFGTGFLLHALQVTTQCDVIAFQLIYATLRSLQ